MRPDRIIIGEVRGPETIDMLQAMNTGHNGSMTTAHANSPRDLMSRLETMVMMGNMDLPLRAIREQMAAALDIVVHQGRFRDGSRKITEIAWIEGMEDDRIKLVPLFIFRSEGSVGGKAKGRFIRVNEPPELYSELRQRGV
jgi:pilus assembly protein CpaF